MHLMDEANMLRWQYVCDRSHVCRWLQHELHIHRGVPQRQQRESTQGSSTPSERQVNCMTLPRNGGLERCDEGCYR